MRGYETAPVTVMRHVWAGRGSLIGDERLVARQSWACGGGCARCRRRTTVAKGRVDMCEDKMPMPAPGGVAAALKMSYTCRGYRVGR